MFFLLAVVMALAMAMGFLRTGLAHDDPCVSSSCQPEIPRFFYNSTSSRCEQLFRGCGSNNSTFRSLDSCAALCYGKAVCYRPVEYGENPPMRFSHNTDIRGKPKDTAVNFFFYNVSSGGCEGFHFRGSRSNGNLFRTLKECQRLCGDVRDRCSDLVEDGSCQPESPRFFYNSTSSRCEQLFRGCGSNNSMFRSLDSCEALCYGNATASSPLTEDPAPGRPLAEAPGDSSFKLLFGIIVLMVVFLVIVTFVAIVIIIVQYCRRASSNGYRLLDSGP